MKEGIRVGLGARELSCQVIKCVLIQSLCLHNFNFILLKIVPDTESVMTHEVWKNVPGLDIMRRAWYVTYAKSIVPPRCKKLLDYESWAQTTRCIWVGWQSAEEEQKHLREEHTFANTFNFIKVEKNKYKAAALEVIFMSVGGKLQWTLKGLRIMNQCLKSKWPHQSSCELFIFLLQLTELCLLSQFQSKSCSHSIKSLYMGHLYIFTVKQDNKIAFLPEVCFIASYSRFWMTSWWQSG